MPAAASGGSAPKTAAGEQKNGETRFRALIQSASDMIFIIDKRGALAYESPSVSRILGYPPGFFLGRPPFEMIHPDDLNLAMAEMDKVNRLANDGLPTELRLKRADGAWIFMEALANNQFDNPLIGGIVVTARDITERKRSEAALRESEFRFRTFFNSNPEGVAILDFDGGILDVNKALAKMSGYRPDEIVGRRVTDFIPEEHHAFLLDAVAEIKAGILRDAPVEMACIKKGGDRIPISAKGWRITDEESRPVSLGVFIRDLTREKKLAREKAALEKQLIQTQRMEAIGTLAGGVAHDFNNILGGIIGYAELALLNEPDDPASKKRAYLGRILDAGNRARDLVRQILRFSRRDKAAMGPVALTPLIKESIKLLRSTLPRTIRIDQSVRADPDVISGDPTQIHQVIMNLCTNAYHAMRETGGVLTLSLENVALHAPRTFMSMHAPPGNYLKLRISDTGTGIAPEIRERIFEPYFTTKKVNEGTGLGLSVTLGIVRAHKGLIEISSGRGAGTRCDIYFPLNEETAPGRPSAEGPAPTGNQERVLLVDDELFFLDVVRENLSYLGYRVTARQSSLKALEVFSRNPEGFDLLVTDQTMPEMTGVQLAAEIRKYNPRLPVVLCTGYSETVTEQSARHYGITRFVMKPVNARELAVAVREALSAAAGRGGPDVLPHPGPRPG